MATFIERQLALNAQKVQGEYSLYNQWMSDKETLTVALEAIGTVFPHYSRHDGSHSVAILNNIYKVLGRSFIERLSDTDLWLLLMAAYCHDLGMVVLAKRLTEPEFSGKFIEYYERVRADRAHPCHCHVEAFRLEDGKLHYANGEFAIGDFEACRFLLADFFRAEHGANSRRVFHDEACGISLSVGKHPLINTRLLYVLGDICEAHTADFKRVMELPFEAVGVNDDDVHPRFVACMLRLGDLLDIDNNRFSDVSLETLTELPEETELHRAKHRSIRHICLNPQRIEIVARCSDPQAATKTQEWFDWIRNEVTEQIKNWNTIVPDKALGFLPSIGELGVEVDDYETVDASYRPTFTIEPAKAIEFIQGKNVYDRYFSAIREALQNAVDTSILRLWVEAYDCGRGRSEAVSFEDFLERAKGYPIKVEVGTEDNRCVVAIEDRGMGIAKDELQYLYRIGTSTRNRSKKMLVDSMPEWMRPSGIFGIGFQSLFLLTDRVTMVTTSYWKGESYEIELYGPESVNKGGIFIRRVREEPDALPRRREPGTRLSFEIRPEVYECLRDDYPFEEEDTADAFRAEVLRMVDEYRRLSFFSINTGAGILSNRWPMVWDEGEQVEVCRWPQGARYCFKNAPVINTDNIRFRLDPYFGVNIHGKKADELLALSRDQFLSKAADEIKRITLEAVAAYFNRAEEIRIWKDYKFRMFADYYGIKGKLNEDRWSRVSKYDEEPLFNGTKVTVSRILGQPELSCSLSGRKIVVEFGEEGSPVVFFTREVVFQEEVEMWQFLCKQLSRAGKFCVRQDSEGRRVKVGGDGVRSEEEDAFKRSLNLHAFPGFEKWGMIPFVGEFPELRLPFWTVCDMVYDKVWDRILPQDVILSPFKMENGVWVDRRNRSFYEWVLEKRRAADPGVRLEDVEAGYNRFVSRCRELGFHSLPGAAERTE